MAMYLGVVIALLTALIMLWGTLHPDKGLSGTDIEKVVRHLSQPPGTAPPPP
jgi:hypothetical protein